MDETRLEQSKHKGNLYSVNTDFVFQFFIKLLKKIIRKVLHTKVFASIVMSLTSVFLKLFGLSSITSGPQY